MTGPPPWDGRGRCRRGCRGERPEETPTPPRAPTTERARPGTALAPSWGGGIKGGRLGWGWGKEHGHSQEGPGRGPGGGAWRGMGEGLGEGPLEEGLGEGLGEGRGGGQEAQGRGLPWVPLETPHLHGDPRSALGRDSLQAGRGQEGGDRHS